MNIIYFTLLLVAFSAFVTPDEQKTLHEWTPAAVVSDEAVKAYSLDSCFKAYPINDAIFARMQGKSFKQNCTMPRASLRYLRVLHRNTEGKTQLGEIVCNQSIANDLLDIFRNFMRQGTRLNASPSLMTTMQTMKLPCVPITLHASISVLCQEPPNSPNIRKDLPLTSIHSTIPTFTSTMAKWNPLQVSLTPITEPTYAM